MYNGAGEAPQPSPERVEPGPLMDVTVFPAPEDNGVAPANSIASTKGGNAQNPSIYPT
ncbi:hypothetical protein [Conexivisphaera calida]|uniref:hypothetical protein n=1 Tax=Conexivisphaera calida TaxID=1874277 RepID=UPI00157A76B5|nr:hypothetical protein [Conexivisphaera calida]